MKLKRKRLLSILLSLALMLGMLSGMSLTAYADEQTVVWSGEKAVTQDNPVSIDKDKFSGIKLGDKIVVEFKDADGGLLSLFSNGKCLPGTSYNYVGSWDSAYEVFATQDMIKSLKQYGMDVSGYGYTVTKVSYEAGRDNLDVNTVWSGNFWMDSWSTLELSATSFSDVDWDEIEAIRFISEAGRSNWTLNIRSSWDDDGKIADQGSMTWEDNYFELDLENIDMAAKLQGKDRLFIQGDKGEDSPFSFTQVQLVPKPATPYPLWVSGVQVTNYNQDDVLDDDPVNCGKVSYIPAVADDPATTEVDESIPAILTLNGATINGSYGENGAAAIYAKDMDLTINVTGTNTVTGSGDNFSCGISVIGKNESKVNLTITGAGTLNANGNQTKGGYGVNASYCSFTVEQGATLNATGGSGGYYSYGAFAGYADVNVNGTLNATGNTVLSGGYSFGVYVFNDNVNVAKSGNLTAAGNSRAINGTVKNAIAGTGWTDTAGTEGETAIAASEAGQSLANYKKVHFSKPSHTHSFTYAASGTTITATCTADGCTLPLVEGKHIATLTIAAPLHTTYGDSKDATAVITDDNSIQGEAKVQYQKKTDGSYGTATETAPTDAGDYKASITVDGATASVEYTIAQADPTANAPTGLTATYGQTLADVSLEGKNPEGNTPGTWAWADSTQSVGNVVSPAATFKAIFTPDSSNYKTVENVEVTVTVSKAENPATVTGTASVTAGGNIVDLAGNVTKNGATGDVSYAISGDANGCSMNGSVLTSGSTAGTVTVNVTVATDDNYNALAATPITVTINEKQTQTITADDVTVTFGDTGKSITATTDGGGDLSYAVKSGDAVTVDETTGALTIVKAGSAVITVTAAETATYAQATKDVNITVNQVNSSGEVTAVSGLVYDGTEKALVDSKVHGGILMYRLGTDGEWTEEIPEAADFGTYTVYYYIKGDGNHKDNGSETEPMGSVDVTIKCPYSNEWVDGKWYNKDGSQTYKPLGSWKKDGKNWMYVDTSGWYAKNRWQKIDFKWYFFDKEGHMLKDAYQKDASGKIWYIGKNGAWDEKAAVIGWKQDSKGWWFGLYGKDYLKNTWKMINGNWYYFKADGYVAQNEFVNGWWCNKNGVQRDPVKYSWHKTSKGWWYGVSGGWYAKNATYTIDGKSYTFDKMGYQK